MPPAELHCDPEQLLRDAASGIAVAAYARGISVVVHADNRLPNQLRGDPAAIGAFLRRGLQRMIEAGHTAKIALALWYDDGDPEGAPRVLLEVCRALDPDDPPMLRLPDLWTLPLGGETARPVPARQDTVGESVLIPLPLAAVPVASTLAGRRGDVFRGRRLLHVRDVLFDRDRLLQSMAAIGADLSFAAAKDEALQILRNAAADSRPIDVVLIDGHKLGPEAVALARQVRGEPMLAGSRLILASAVRGGGLADREAALFDVLPWAAAPWRRLLDAMHDLLRGETDPAGSSPAWQHQAEAIPALDGRRIIVAEDVSTNQLVIKAVLAPTGAAIEVVEDGALAVERHRAEPGDLIIMDLQMPGVGGIGALHQIRAMGGSVGAVPVIALTAYARGADRQSALAAGMDAYLAKPIVVAELYQLLRHFLLSGAGSA